MTEGENGIVFDAEGVRGTSEARPDVIGGRACALLGDGALFFAGSFEGPTAAAVVPVVKTGRVRVHKTVREHEAVVDEPLMSEEYDVERVPVERADAARGEADVTEGGGRRSHAAPRD